MAPVLFLVVHIGINNIENYSVATYKMIEDNDLNADKMAPCGING